MTKSKVLKSCLLYFLFNAVIAFVNQYYSARNTMQWLGVSQMKSYNDFLNMLVYDYGFYGYIYFFFMGTVVTLLILMQLMPKIEELVMIRSRSYRQYAYSQFRLCGINAFLSVVIYITVVIFVMIQLFPGKKLIQYGFIPMTIFEIIAAILFYTRISLLYSILQRLTNRKVIAFGFVLILNGLEFALTCQIPNSYGIYIPLDLIAFPFYATLHGFSLMSGIMAMIRQGCLIVIYFTLYRLILERKDVLTVENEH